MWKTWKSLVPKDLEIQFYDYARLGTWCKIPPMRKNYTTLAKSTYDASFVVLGPKLWNTISKGIIAAPSLESFKSQLTCHLMSNIPDLPPVPGYTTQNSNSLLEWEMGGLQQVVLLGLHQRPTRGRYTPNGLDSGASLNPTNKLAYWVDLLGQPLSQNHVSGIFRVNPLKVNDCLAFSGIYLI